MEGHNSRGFRRKFAYGSKPLHAVGLTGKVIAQFALQSFAQNLGFQRRGFVFHDPVTSLVLRTSLLATQLSRSARR
jgi:hypothetical protein